MGYYFSGKGNTKRIADEIQKIKVNDMKSVPAGISASTSVYDAAVNLFVLDVGSLFIVSEGGLLEGVVSRKDLLKFALGQTDIHKVPVTVAMTRMPNIITVSAEESLWSAARKMVEHGIDSLPVVRSVVHEGREGLEVVGRVTKTTITRAYYELGHATYNI